MESKQQQGFKRVRRGAREPGHWRQPAIRLP